MGNKKWIAAITALCIGCSAQLVTATGLAVQNMNAVFDQTASKATVDGVSPYGEGSYVTVSVIKNGNTAPLYFRETTAGENGAVEFLVVWKDTDPTGTYTIRLSGAGFDGDAKEVVFINSSDNTAILAKMNGIAEDAGSSENEKSQTVQTRIAEVEKHLGISFTDVLSRLDAEQKAEVYLSMTNRTFASAYDVRSEFYKAAVIEKLNHGGTAQTVTDYADYFGFEVGEGSRFAQIKSADAKTRVYNSVLNKNFSLRDTQAVADAFDKAVYVELINQLDTESRDMLISLIQNCIDDGFTEISLTEYHDTEFDDADRLQIVKKVLKAKEGTRFADLNAVNSALQAAAQAVRNDNGEANPPSVPSGNGGGGFARGGGVRVEANMEEVKEENNANQTEIPVYGFTDIAHLDWAWESIGYLASKEVLSGDGNGHFEPDRAVTREEFVKMIVTALPVPAESTQKQFADVTPEAWYYDYVMQAYAANLVNGVEEDRFGVGEGLSREQMCTIVYRALNLLNINIETENGKEVTFHDASEISDYATDAVQSLARAEIINGMGNGDVKPKTTANRAMAAKVIYQILQRGNLL